MIYVNWSLHHSAQVHHYHVVGHLGDDSQIVGDQHDGHPVALLEIEQQVENLRLGRHIKRRRRLVGD